MTGDYIEELLELETKLFTHTFFWPHFTVSILSAGVGLEGKNHFLTPSEKIKTVFFSLIFHVMTAIVLEPDVTWYNGEGSLYIFWQTFKTT